MGLQKASLKLSWLNMPQEPIKVVMPKLIDKVHHCDIHGDVRVCVEEGQETSCPICEQEKIQKETELKKLRSEEHFRHKQLVFFLGDEPFSLVDNNQTFETYKLTATKNPDHQKHAFNVAKRFAVNFSKRKKEGRDRSKIGLIFHGIYGAGKTHLASAIANEVAKQGYIPYFWTTRWLFCLFKNGADLSHFRLMNFLTECPLLILDEVGRGAGSEFESNLLIELLDARARLGNPTVLITNLTGEQYKDMLGGAITSRTQSLFYRVQFDWEDYRKKQSLKDLPIEQIF